MGVVVLSLAAGCGALLCSLGAAMLAWRAFVTLRAERDEMAALMHEITVVRGTGRIIQAQLSDVHASLLRQVNERATRNHRAGRGPLAVVRDDARA